MKNLKMHEILEIIKWNHIRRTFELTNILVDPNRIIVLESFEVSQKKSGFAVLIDKKLGYTIYI